MKTSLPPIDNNQELQDIIRLRILSRSEVKALFLSLSKIHYKPRSLKIICKWNTCNTSNRFTILSITLVLKNTLDFKNLMNKKHISKRPQLGLLHLMKLLPKNQAIIDK